jgi:hypothetical protein
MMPLPLDALFIESILILRVCFVRDEVLGSRGVFLATGQCLGGELFFLFWGFTGTLFMFTAELEELAIVLDEDAVGFVAAFLSSDLD